MKLKIEDVIQFKQNINKSIDKYLELVENKCIDKKLEITLCNTIKSYNMAREIKVYDESSSIDISADFIPSDSSINNESDINSDSVISESQLVLNSTADDIHKQSDINFDDSSDSSSSSSSFSSFFYSSKDIYQKNIGKMYEYDYDNTNNQTSRDHIINNTRTTVSSKIVDEYMSVQNH